MQIISKRMFRLVIVLVLQCSVIFVVAPLKASAFISADAYCQLSIQLMQQEVSNFQTLISLVNQYSTDRDILNQQEEIKKAEFTQARQAIFTSFGITNNEYGTYMGANSQLVDAYLAENPQVKLQIDALSAQVNSLMDQYEALKGAVTETPDAPPAE